MSSHASRALLMRDGDIPAPRPSEGPRTVPVADFVSNPGWIGAYREGRREILEVLYRGHVRSVERYLRSLARAYERPDMGQASAIADFLQEAFTRAFSPSARLSYDGQREFGAYLTVIARNCFIDAFRARGREVLHAEDEGRKDYGMVHPDQQVPTHEDGLDPRVRAVLAGYVSGLAPELREVYSLRFADGKSQEQACLTLGLSRRTLRTREQHLRTGLRRALVKAGVSLAELRVAPTNLAPPSLRAMVPTSRTQP